MGPGRGGPAAAAPAIKHMIVRISQVWTWQCGCLRPPAESPGCRVIRTASKFASVPLSRRPAGIRVALPGPGP